MQHYTVYLYLEIALHISGGTSTHHQKRIRLYLQHLVFVTPLLLSATFVEEYATHNTLKQVPRTQHDYHHDTKVKPEAATAVIELLMMGGKTPETC
jgi:hypothetical protein